MRQIKKYSILAILVFPCLALAQAITIDLVYVGDKTDSALLGAQQGLDEANLQGQFLNQQYRLQTMTLEQATTFDYSPYFAVLVATDKNQFIALSQKLTEKPLFNLTLADDDLRAACLKNALHIIPSQWMIRQAVTQWQKKSGHSAKALAWHPNFKKFAGRDLNKRFKARHQTDMDGRAWAGWAAVKMISNSISKTSATNAADLLHYLKTNLSFDGQKGVKMNFTETGQLRQPLLLVENGTLVGEAPVRGIAKPPTLDSLIHSGGCQ